MNESADATAMAILCAMHWRVALHRVDLLKTQHSWTCEGHLAQNETDDHNGEDDDEQSSI